MIGGAAAGAAAGAVVDGGAPGAIVGAGVGAFAGAILCGDYDTDGDGVPDSADRCPDTPKGVAVDANGCPVDSDGDGVADYQDKCPNTPAGTTVVPPVVRSTPMATAYRTRLTAVRVPRLA